MNTAEIAKPVILTTRGVLGSKAVSDLRKAGYCVVQSKDCSQIKQFHAEKFKDVSARAKIAAFEYATSKEQLSNCLSKSELNAWYIHYLKERGAY